MSRRGNVTAKAHVHLYRPLPSSMSYISGIVEFADEEGINCLRCNTGTGTHSCWKADYEKGSPDLKLDKATVRRFS